MHNIHPGANIHPGCKFAPGVHFGHVNGALLKCTRVQICTRVLICSTFVGGANSKEQISTRVHILLGANYAHKRNLLSHMYSLILDFDKLPIFSI